MFKKGKKKKIFVILALQFKSKEPVNAECTDLGVVVIGSAGLDGAGGCGGC